MTKNKIALTLANRIYDTQKGESLTEAFKTAWALAKNEKFRTNIAGVSFGNRQQALRRLGLYDTEQINVRLERDKWNGHDANAIKVNVSVNNGAEYHLGYIPRNLAHLAAALMDKGAELTAYFKAVTGGDDGKSYGALITVKF